MLFLSLIAVGAIVWARYWAKDDVFISLGLLTLNFMVFNILNDSCNWYAWSNNLADTIFLCIFTFRLIVGDRKILYGLICTFFLMRIAIHSGFYDITQPEYKVGINTLFGCATIAAIVVALKKISDIKNRNK